MSRQQPGTRRDKRLKKIFALIGALLTGAIGLSVLVPSFVEAGFALN